MKLVIGDKNLSSWSMRPWMLLKHLGVDFEEIRLPLDTERFEQEIGRYSPSRRVPVLLDGALGVWDSLAIIEYANELCSGRAWPADRAARAEARSISAEMHSGFQALRTEWSMTALSRDLVVPLSPAGQADVARIDQIWRECRERHASHGPWLFGDWSAADAMYAPVLLRFQTYGASLSPTSKAYLEFAMQDPHLQEWLSGAEYEVRTEGRPMSH
jgi:glutathione S-transferase